MVFTDNNYAPEDKIYECFMCGYKITDPNWREEKPYCDRCDELKEMQLQHIYLSSEEIGELSHEF